MDIEQTNMKLLSFKKLQNFTATALIAAVFISIMGTIYFMGMGMESDGRMSDCVFMNMGTGICNMTLLEHLNSWHSMFNAVPQKAATASIILLAVWLLINILIFKNLLLKYYNLLFYNYWLYIKQYSYISLIDPVKRAMYRGLITPKIF